MQSKSKHRSFEEKKIFKIYLLKQVMYHLTNNIIKSIQDQGKKYF